MSSQRGATEVAVPGPGEGVVAPDAANASGQSESLAARTEQRLADQIRWYDRKSIHNQRWFKLLKGLQLIAAAGVPVIATLDLHGAISGALGAQILILEGFQQLNQHQQNWISYRSTCEALRHEKYLYEARAGPYAGDGPRRPARLLAERIEGLISRENDQWVTVREEAAQELSD